MPRRLPADPPPPDRDPRQLSPELASWLAYLEDLGWRDLYLPAARTTAEEEAVTATEQRRTEQRPAEQRSTVRRETMRPRRETRHPPPAAAHSRDSAASSPTGVEPAGLPACLTDPIPETAGERARMLVELGRFTAGCRDCRLAEGRRSVVFGSGNPHADLMFIGEGPGAQEDRQGLPFVGPAGELLTKIIEAIGMTREQVYIANVVKCRPPRNRDPRPDEVAACRGYLERQVALIQPRLIVALGRVAGQTLLGTDQSLGRLRGDWWAFQGVPVRVTYHPAALLRNRQWKRPTWEDMQIVRDRLVEGSA